MDVSVDGAPHGGQQPQQQQMLNGSNSYFRETQQQTQHVFTTSTPNGTNVQTVTYTARQSTDSGIDNPFRPEGELSMEADEIVKAIKEGRPFDSIDSGRVSRQENGVTSMTITTTMTKTSPTSNGNNNNSKSNNNNNNNNNTTSPTSPKNGSAKNGSATKSPSGKKDAKPGVVDVQRGIVVPPSEAQQAEQVVIKKKPKCKCCVIQ